MTSYLWPTLLPPSPAASSPRWLIGSGTAPRSHPPRNSYRVPSGPSTWSRRRRTVASILSWQAVPALNPATDGRRPVQRRHRGTALHQRDDRQTHVTHILQKLGVRDRVRPAVLAYQTGLSQHRTAEKSLREAERRRAVLMNRRKRSEARTQLQGPSAAVLLG